MVKKALVESCATGTMNAQTVIRIAAAVITDKAGRLLLVRKRNTRTFMQPGGKIEAGEAPADALARELFEELGLTVKHPPVPLGRFSAPAANESGAVVTAELFHLLLEGMPRIAAEIEELIWLERGIDTKGLELAPLTRDTVVPWWLAAL